MSPQPSTALVRRQFARRAGRIAGADFLLREVERRMFDKLDLVKLQPARILDLGCGKGLGTAALGARFPAAQVVGLDWVLPALNQVRTRDKGFLKWLKSLTGDGRGETRSAVSRLCADAHILPLPASSIDLLWSNLLWQNLDQPIQALQDWYRVVRPGGLLMFSSFGVDTGRELAALGWPLPVFPDMHDIGDALAKNGFAEPVMDTERITLQYRDARKLVTELSAFAGRRRHQPHAGLRGRKVLGGWLETLERTRQANAGVITVTVEVVYGHAWCGARKRLPDGLAPVDWRGPKIPSLKK